MTAEQLLSHVTQVTFVVIWASVLVRAIRRPRAATVHSAIFFGLAAAIISAGWAAAITGLELPVPAVQTTSAMLVAMPYLLLMLADDFAGVPRSILGGAGLFLIAVVVSLFVVPMPYSAAYSVLVVAYIVAVLAYSTARFGMAARASSGVSRRRMEAVAIAGSLLALIFVAGGLSVAVPGQRAIWASLSSVASFACGIAYVVGFMPPRFIRQAWQAPQMQRFFAESTLVRHRSLLDLTVALEDRIVSVLGARQVSIAIWDGQEQRLISPRYAGIPPTTFNRDSTAGYRAFHSQTATFVEDAQRSDPVNAAVYRRFGARSIMAAPITVDGRRFGMLLVFGERPPLFAEDELEVVQVLARQVAVLLHDFELADELTEFRAHEEVARLKDDFLAAAAHDLKTPLTTLVAQSQLMQRHALRDPERPPDREGLDRMVREAGRMRRLVDDLLDAARGDQIGFVGQLEAVDLYALVSEVIAGASAGRTVRFEGTPITAPVDADRIRQVVSNLLDNALKYSPNGGDIDVTLTSDEGCAILRVTDYGIGIARDDIPVIFDRFRRAAGVQHVSVTGLGLGLYFCKRIVEEHGGQVAVQSVLGQGSEFEVRLPLLQPQTQARSTD